MKIFHIIISLTCIALLFTSCSGDHEFKIQGEVSGADGHSLVLEKSDFHGRWIPVDSTRVSASGSFSIKAEAPASPEIYRLSLGDRFIYFPIDSVETVTLTTTEPEFGSKFSLSGTPGAERMAAFEQDLQALQSPDSAALARFKRDVFTKYIKDGNGSIVSYYVLTKIYDGKPLYDPSDREDVKYYAAVATQFDNYRPDDPHGRMVKEVALNARRSMNKSNGKQKVIEADELRVIDIDLPDTSGKNRKLSEVVGKGKPVVVVFSMMNENESPAFNRGLNKIYEAHHGNLEIYQISFDAGQYEWREAAANLPWINVIDPNGTSSRALIDYNVSALPAVFLYNASGDLTDRPASLEELDKLL